MASPLYQSIEALSRDKGIDPEIIVGAVEDAIALATRKSYKTQENMRAELDRESGEIRAYIYKAVVGAPEEIEDPLNQITLEEARQLAPGVEVGGEIRFYKPTDVLGRIAAQMAKQVIFQKVREAERDTVFNEYAHRIGEILTATVKRVEPQDVIFDLGKAEARMPRREQSRLEQFAIGERVRVVLLRVDRAAKGPQVIVSRAAPELVQSLFQGEVPEIYDGTVTIRAIAREAGERTKIAVVSRDKDVDPVGACVGMKGMRVQSIIRELRGEKIDIIEFSEEVTTFAERALQPAKVSRVSITDLAEKQLEVIVDDTQLSLAIGKKGQNVRLAAKLLGWKIDIKSEEEKRQELEQQMVGFSGTTTAIEEVKEIGDSVMQKLVNAGITSVEALADMTPEQLEEIPGIGEKTLEKISVAVRHYFGQYEPGEDRPAPEPGTEPAPESAEGQDAAPAEAKAEAQDGAQSEAEADEAEAKAQSEAEISEEISALKQDLTQAGPESESEDSSGVVHNEIAEEVIAEHTEAGSGAQTEGAESMAPGSEDTSETIVEHQRHAEGVSPEQVEEEAFADTAETDTGGEKDA